MKSGFRKSWLLIAVCVIVIILLITASNKYTRYYWYVIVDNSISHHADYVIKMADGWYPSYSSASFASRILKFIDDDYNNIDPSIRFEYLYCKSETCTVSIDFRRRDDVKKYVTHNSFDKILYSWCDLVYFENISSKHLENEYVFFCDEYNLILRMSNYEYLDAVLDIHNRKPGTPESENRLH